MILESLKVINFRVFKGTHEFSLAPKPRDGQHPPIILFGGLNGAGKTTTLTAIRLALYGRQSLGIGTTIKDYHHFLADSVHNSKVTGIKANNASVALVFSYANLGVISHYHIKRSWTVMGSKITESLKVSQDGHPHTDLNYEQAQGFLNELIPIGVSDLFFFDGEKIAQLAEDTEGNVLGESVKKLIGLDLIEKLIANINIFIRKQNKQQLSDDIKSKINILEQALTTKEQAIDAEQVNYESIKICVTHASKQIDQLTNILNAQGGAWAASREEEIKKLSSYNTEKEMLQSQLRESISSSFPFAIAPVFVKHCLSQLENEEQSKHNKNIAKTLSKHISSLKQRLLAVVDQPVFASIKKEMDSEFSELLAPQDNDNIIHDVSQSLHKKIESAALDAINHQQPKVNELAQKLKSLNESIDSAGVNIARAPEQDLLSLQLKELNKAQTIKSELAIQLSQQKEKIKDGLRGTIDTVRTLDKLHNQFVDSDESNRALDYAHKAKASLTEFAKRVAVNKIKNVESEFVQSFKNLARKDDTNINAKIEPHTFSVTLLNDFGNEIPKESLSAGERQIYAIAMLDALAKTSGRKLPIIIDTPLGRLDSKHRKKLVENYFPSASHQVIILSTDTEIGKTYLASLGEHISHKIMLDYDDTNGSSNIESGYFWQTKETAV
jgi:DNA sulfur modification protein DndD